MVYMIKQRIETYLKKNRCTLLGVGPMSLNCVDASIELSNDHDIPLILIASRRQIDSEEFGGGYVNNWTTEEFAKYIFAKDKKGNILLSRDHGGPWQGIKEINEGMNLSNAMKSAKASFNADISSGFHMLHIDTSVDIHGKPDIDEVMERLFELYDHCCSQAQKNGKEIIFEIGTEEQTGSTNSQEELEYTLNKIHKFCNENYLPKPTFVVIQSGTRVMEMRNVGSFDSPVRVADEVQSEIQLPKMIEICSSFEIFMKEHNTDYLSNEALQWHPKLGIHASNVAPEFGVTETKALLRILETYGLEDLSQKFLQLSYDSKKWEKWMLPNTKATDRDRAIIAGHYVFSHQDCIELKEDANRRLVGHGINVDLEIKEAVKKNILRYIYNFRLIKTV